MAYDTGIHKDNWILSSKKVFQNHIDDICLLIWIVGWIREVYRCPQPCPFDFFLYHIGRQRYIHGPTLNPALSQSMIDCARSLGRVIELYHYHRDLRTHVGKDIE